MYVGFILYLSLLNKGSQESLELLKPIITALGTFVLLYNFLLTPHDHIERKVRIVLLTDKSRLVDFQTLIPLEKWHDLSGQSHISLLNNFALQEPDNPFNPRSQDNILQFIEWVTLSWMAQKYSSHWYVEENWFQGVSGGGGSIHAKKGAEKDPKITSIKELIPSNIFAEKYDVMTTRICLPKDMKHSFDKEKHILRLEDDYSKVEFRFFYSGGSKKGVSEFVKLIEHQRGPLSDEWFYHIEVDINVSFKMMRRWSVKTKQEKEWLSDFINQYDRAFSWETLMSVIDSKTLIGPLVAQNRPGSARVGQN